MVLAVLVFLGGMLTILSPCILPVLPFVFARAEQPFLKSGLPLLIEWCTDIRRSRDSCRRGWLLGGAYQSIRPRDRPRVDGGVCVDATVAARRRLACPPVRRARQSFDPARLSIRLQCR